ncbi:MAG: hypothetical protein DRI84_02505 [Bacteroidetes bacterium]|nr:MAG: hypothetical protein DRI84_02505 [Bacteroidota bacterium]
MLIRIPTFCQKDIFFFLFYLFLEKRNKPACRQGQETATKKEIGLFAFSYQAIYLVHDKNLDSHQLVVLALGLKPEY